MSEAQFERLQPLLPDKVRGIARVDDLRVNSGIIHVVKSDGRWVDALGGEGREARAVREICGGGRPSRNSKLHALTDGEAGRSASC